MPICILLLIICVDVVLLIPFSLKDGTRLKLTDSRTMNELHTSMPMARKEQAQTLESLG